MNESKCPICGCKTFYIKNPDDQYDTYAFECRDGEVCFGPDVDSDECPAIKEDTETYCATCAWHDKFNAIK